MADPSSPTTYNPSTPSSSTAPTSLGSLSRSRAQRQGSSTESSQSNVDTSSPFRQGFPNPLRPLPQAHFVVTARDTEGIGWWKTTREAVIGYLEVRKIDWDSISVIYRCDPRDEPSPDDLTIFISAPYDAGSNSWYLMLQDLQGYLQDRGLAHLRVEIMDGRFARIPDHFIVESTHPLVPAWPGIRDSIIKALGRTPWITLTAIRRGIDSIAENNPVTILITTPNPPTIRPLIKPIESICENAGFALNAEVLEGSSLFAMDDPGEVVLDISSFADPIPMGSSASPRSRSDSSGTLGGAILLTKGKLRALAGVTNFHVMRTKDLPQVYIDDGLQPGQSTRVGIRAVVPSNQDYNHNLDISQDYLETTIKPALVMAEQKWEMSGDEQDRKRMQSLTRQKQDHCQHNDTLQMFSRDAGFLWAASGLRIHQQNKFMLDWALVKLPKYRPTPNLLPTRGELVALGAERLTRQVLLSGTKLEEWSTEMVKGGEVVFKRGRTTGLTIGAFSGINPAIQLNGKTFSAWQVAGQRGKEFCRKGDSGSFIVDSRGRWCALLFASPYNNTGDAYVIPVDILIEDIQSMTGGTVSLP
ncbi:MAG: hypothetical protein M1840_003743 [Geoglossum simile]|nr:MAG: hypothetical protein M1840_003743 [Geoglossum simile]